MVGKDRPKVFGLRVLLVYDKLHEPTAIGRDVRALVADRKTDEIDATVALAATDAQMRLNPRLIYRPLS